MAYVPVAQREKPKSGYTPVAERKSSTLTSFGSSVGLPSLSTQTSTQAVPTEKTPSTLDVVSNIGTALDYTSGAIAQAPSRVVASALGQSQPKAKTFSEQAFEATGSQGLPKPLAQTLGFGAAILGDPLNLIGGAGPKGLKGLTKILRNAKKVEEVAPLMKEAGFADDIIEQYAPIFAKETSVKKIEEGLLSAEKLQNTTKSYTPVAERITKTTDDLTQSIQKAKASGQSFDEWVKGQGENLQHATTKEIAEIKPINATKGEAFYLSEVGQNKASAIATRQGVLQDFVLDTKKTKTFDPRTSNSEINKIVQDSIDKVHGKGRFRYDPEASVGGRDVITRVDDTLQAEVIRQANKKGYNHFRFYEPSTQEYSHAITDNALLKTRSQLKAEWDKVADDISPELAPLAEEARKYKSAEEFVKNRSLETDLQLVRRSDDAVENLAKLQRNKPELVDEDGFIEIYHGGKFNGDTLKASDDELFFLTDSLEEAQDYARINKGSVSEIKTRPEFVSFNEGSGEFEISQNLVKLRDPNSLEEFFAPTPTKSQLTDFYNKVTKTAGTSKDLPVPNGLPKITKATSETEGVSKPSLTKQPIQEMVGEVPQLPEDIKKVSRQTKELETTSKQNVPDKSRVVNDDSSRKVLSEDTYKANIEQIQKKTGKIQAIKDGLSASVKSFGEGTDKLLGTISTRLKNINPILKKSIRDFEFKLAQNTQKDRRAVAPFIKAVRSKDIPLEDYATLDLALKNGDITKTKAIINKYGLQEEFKSVRATLENLYKRAEDVGYDIGYEKNYFPRMIEDSSGLLEYLQKGDDWSLIDEVIKTKETELGRYLTTNEKANVVNTLVRGYPQGKITLSKTGAMKARQIDIVDAELNQFYRDSIESLLRYVDSTNDAIEARRFFGKGNKADEFAHIDDSIGSYILNLLADGKIKPSQEQELRDILQARFAPKGTSGVTQVYKNLSYIDTMGSVTSAITQLGDLAFSLYKGGVVNTAKALGKAVVGKSEITRADIGIEKIAQEFNDSSTSANAVSKVFKWVGLEKLDALGKETVINATISKFRKQAEDPTVEFIRKLESVFGDDQQIIKGVLDDLKTGKITEDTKLLAFNELLDVQPVALSEMPEQYLKGGNGRIFYMLKTYTIKLFDVYRNEVFELMRKDPMQATKNLVYLSASLVAMNATADEIKDLILNRKTSLSDRVVDNILKLAGFSKFTIYKAREEGIGSAVAKTILPPFKFIDSLYKDIVQGNELSQLETIQSIPVAGKLYYWWFGKGATKTRKKNKPSSSGSKKLPTPSGLPSLNSTKTSLPVPKGLPSLR